jgi:hypothetical protein
VEFQQPILKEPADPSNEPAAPSAIPRFNDAKNFRIAGGKLSPIDPDSESSLAEKAP